ncbi:MAG: hypothetical protein CSA35_02635 [Dethiosulfovibrio peptidovorans]|nr:MAG: hypothetical protein CSA35_02635 [Dethiosulfovibrio peptidovorans]
MKLNLFTSSRFPNKLKMALRESFEGQARYNEFPIDGAKQMVFFCSHWRWIFFGYYLPVVCYRQFNLKSYNISSDHRLSSSHNLWIFNMDHHQRAAPKHI